MKPRKSSAIASSLQTISTTHFLLERLHRFIRESGIIVAAFGVEHLAAAQDAYMRFGRGSGHAAKLNYGDCFSYALASVSGEADIASAVHLSNHL